LVRSGEMSIALTVPSETSLNLSCDWPAVSPPALVNSMVMVGPRLEKVSQASQAPIKAVITGTSQISGMRRWRRLAAVATLAAALCVSILTVAPATSRPDSIAPTLPKPADRTSPPREKAVGRATVGRSLGHCGRPQHGHR